jgi:RNA-directed DNA polymerase
MMPSLVSSLSPRKGDSRHEHEAERFLKDLREQLGQYGLELNEEKTRLIRFGRFARQNREERGEGKPESFTFPGFKHICAKNSVGRFEIRRITDGDRRRKKPQAINLKTAVEAPGIRQLAERQAVVRKAIVAGTVMRSFYGAARVTKRWCDASV